MGKILRNGVSTACFIGSLHRSRQGCVFLLEHAKKFEDINFGGAEFRPPTVGDSFEQVIHRVMSRLFPSRSPSPVSC